MKLRAEFRVEEPIRQSVSGIFRATASRVCARAMIDGRISACCLRSNSLQGIIVWVSMCAYLEREAEFSITQVGKVQVCP
ncbi:hypothetical protein MHYP_G00009280 [Metynnis hypsauchen]